MERLPELVHALPPPGTPIDVADLPGAPEAVAWLTAHGRPACVVPTPSEPRETRLWDPSPTVARVSRPSDLSHAPTALDLGCGTGRDAVWLALHGWRVTAVDRLPDALDRARLLSELHGVELNLRLLDTDLPLSEWLVSERGPGGEAKGYDLVLAIRFLPDLTKAAAALAPGGTLLVETFTDRERARTGKPRDPRLVLPAEGPPPIPEGLTLVDYRVREHAGRELATLNAKRL